MDTTPRTRLFPGSSWLRVTAESQLPREGPPSVTPRGPGLPPARPDKLPAQPMPGVEVSELNSDTVFDRHFGHLPPASPPRR